MTKKKEAPKAFHVAVAEKIIAQLEKGTAPWQKPWSMDGVAGFELPFNASTGQRYKGMNVLSLLSAGFEDPRWLTFKQSEAEGFQVKKGEKGSMVQYVKTKALQQLRDEKGKIVFAADGKPKKIWQQLSRPIISNAWVFNASQIEGMPQIKKENLEPLSWDPLERAENIIRSSGAYITHVPGDRAYYRPYRDEITMPVKEQFSSAGNYYATLLHELGHWTGHKNRLDRTVMNEFGTENYAKEELRAEISSMLIGQEIGIGHDPSQHVAYVESWISLLKDKPFELHLACADAEKIFNYLLDFERKREKEIAAETETGKDQKQSSHLLMGDTLLHGENSFRVVSLLKKGRLRLEDLSTGNEFILSRTDALYAALQDVKKSALGISSNEAKELQTKEKGQENNQFLER